MIGDKWSIPILPLWASVIPYGVNSLAFAPLSFYLSVFLSSLGGDRSVSIPLNSTYFFKVVIWFLRVDNGMTPDTTFTCGFGIVELY